MLPTTVQFIIAMIASALTERMARKLIYTQEKVRVLKKLLEAATGKKRITFHSKPAASLGLKG